MELQFRKSTCRCLDRVVREVKNEEVTQELRLPEGMPDMGRILTAWGQVVLRSKEWRGGTAVVSGGVMVWVLYAPEDGSDPRCVDSWIPFSVKWNVSEAPCEGSIRAMPLLRFADGRALSTRKMMIRAGVAVCGEMLCERQVQTAQPGEVPEDVQLLKNTYPLRLPREAGEKTFLLDEELAIPEDVPAMEKLLCYTIRPEMTEQKIAAGKMVFRGILNLHLVYRSSEGQLCSCDLAQPFSQFQELDAKLSENARADCALVVTSLELNHEEGRLQLKCGLVCQFVLEDLVMLELVQDAYSPRRPVEIAMDSLELPAVLEERREKISVQQMLPDRKGKLVDLSFLLDFPRQRRTMEEVMFELPGLFQVLYYEEDGTLQTATARWEGQYRIQSGDGVRMDTMIVPAGGPQCMDGGDGMELRSQLMLQISATACQGIPMVSGLELGQGRESDSGCPSLILCRSNGEKLWDIAKRCGSTVYSIRRANGLEDEPDVGRMLLIPVS